MRAEGSKEIEDIGVRGLGVGPLVDYQQPARPRLVPEGEDERHEAWLTTDR